VSLSGVCPRSTRSPKDPYLPLADPRVARLCHGRRREQRTKRRAPVSSRLRWPMVTLRPAYMAHLRRPLLVLATLCPPFEYLDDPLASMHNCKRLEGLTFCAELLKNGAERLELART
jgi:hypothetical protein